MRLPFAVSSLTALVLLAFAAQPIAAVSPDTTASVPAMLKFANAVAIAGDQILVGRAGTSARQDTPMGAVHVFQQKAGQWTETAAVAPKDIKAEDQFGSTVAVDGSLLAVGAPGAEGGRGAVYIFERDKQGRWTERAKLIAAAGAATDSLGLSTVALGGGLLAAGAPSHASGRGMVVVFRRGADAKTWTQQAVLQAPDSTKEHRFGRSTAIVDGKLYVGAPGWLGGQPQQWIPGQVVVYRDSAKSWVEEARLTSDDPSALGFGADIVVDGATLWTTSPNKSGAAYEFHRDASGHWTKAATIRPAGSTQNSFFGIALARDGQDLIVGAVGAKQYAGAIYVFHSDSTRAPWTSAQQLTAPNAASGTLFGYKLAAQNGLLVAGTPRGNGGEGFAIVYHRAAQQNQWQPVNTIADTAWNTSRPLAGAGPYPCKTGKVNGVFDCQNTELLAFLPKSAFGGEKSQEINDLWGWTDAATGREFALVGRDDGTSFVEVTDPLHPKYLGNLPYSKGAKPSIWRDIKVIKNYAFIVSEAQRHGIQIFDLTQLRDVKNAPATFQESAHYDSIGHAHNIVADTATGFVYAVGASECGGGLHMVDVNDPLHPKFAGCYAEAQTGRAGTGYIHDAECTIYHGPDKDYEGHEICFNAAETAVSIADVTDKKNPKTIAVANYPKVGYTHQGWLTGDQRYFFVGDELDEGQNGGNTRTLVFDFKDLDDPVLAKEFLGTTPATDHNMYIVGKTVYQSNYIAGLRILDITDPVNPKEVGYFKTTLSEITPQMSGSWSNYPFFKSGAIAVTSGQEGLYLVRNKATADGGGR